jgi:malonyl CoA-acyl carrier protein transacylase
MAAKVDAATGHSQGLAAAAVVACATSVDDLIVKAEALVKFLVFLSARCQAATNKFLVRCSSLPSNRGQAATNKFLVR